MSNDGNDQTKSIIAIEGTECSPAVGMGNAGWRGSHSPLCPHRRING